MRESSSGAIPPAISEMASPEKWDQNHRRTDHHGGGSEHHRPEADGSGVTAASSGMPSAKRSSIKSTRMIEFLTDPCAGDESDR